MSSPAHTYKALLRWGLHTLTTREEEAALFMGKKISDQSMDTLEAAYALIFKKNPRDLAPSGYRTRR